MLFSYLPILLLLAVAVAFPMGLLLATTLLGPRVPSKEKAEPYESGVPPVGNLRDRVPVKFFRIAILFLLFDVEAAFLFPWAVLFRPKMSEWGAPFLIGELCLFLMILVAGYVFAWRRGGLEWE